MKKENILVERAINAPVNKVWKALTDTGLMKQWYFDIEKFEPKVGFKFDFMGGPDGGPQYLHLCEITEVKENEKLTHTWRYDNYPGNSIVCWQMMDKGEKTLVRFDTYRYTHFSRGQPRFCKRKF